MGVRVFACFSRPNVRLIAQHGFTEMVNNAIDHSQGSEVSILMTQDEATVTLQVSDNGIGIFRKIAGALELVDLRQALFELAKGSSPPTPQDIPVKASSLRPEMFDGFVIEANGLTYSHFQPERDFLQEVGETKTIGTRVIMRIGLGSVRTTAEVFQQFMDAPEDYGFTKTVVPMNLARYGDEGLVSRSQARRLIARFDRFKTVMLDFAVDDRPGIAMSRSRLCERDPDVTLGASYHGRSHANAGAGRPLPKAEAKSSDARFRSRATLFPIYAERRSPGPRSTKSVGQSQRHGDGPRRRSLDLHRHDLRIRLNQSFRTCSVAAKPICAFCIATIVCSRLTVGLSRLTSRCIARRVVLRLADGAERLAERLLEAGARRPRRRPSRAGRRRCRGRRGRRPGRSRKASG